MGLLSWPGAPHQRRQRDPYQPTYATPLGQMPGMGPMSDAEMGLAGMAGAIAPSPMQGLGPVSQADMSAYQSAMAAPATMMNGMGPLTNEELARLMRGGR